MNDMDEVRSIEIPEKGRFQADRVPSRTTWPPSWLVEAESVKSECKAADIAEPPRIDVRSERPVGDPLPLARVLPPLSCLTRAQRERFEEKAAIMQYDGKLSREEAEQEALSELIFTGGIG
jgi:hypothetical protein